MSKHPVLKSFRDGQDNNTPYGSPNGLYPRDEYEPNEERKAELIALGYIGELPDPETVDESNTNSEIKAVLDEKGIEYNVRSNKKELLDLLDDGEPVVDGDDADESE